VSWDWYWKPQAPAYPYLPPTYRPAIWSPPAELGENLIIEANSGCMPVGIGAKGDNISIVLRHDYAEHCRCPTDTWLNWNEWCPECDNGCGLYCHSPMNYEGVIGPGSPTSENLPYHTARCPTTEYRFEVREWPSGESENTIEAYGSATPIKPSHWIDRLSKPWTLTDIVVDTGGTFVLMKEPFGEHLFQINPETYEIINEKNIFAYDFTTEYGLTGGRPVSLAGNATTLYILYTMEAWAYPPQYFKMVVFDVAAWDATDVIQMADEVFDSTIYKIGGDGVNGYLYSLRYDNNVEECFLEKRYASVSQKFAVATSLNLTQTYYDTAQWVWNPYSDQAPSGFYRIWCLGGDSNRLFGAGVDCVAGDVFPIFYEFDPDTLAYVGKSNVCKTVYADLVKIVSFW